MPGLPPPEPLLDARERAQLARAVSEFNRGAYFECHDTLEDLWSGLRGPSRDFFQGLIQIAVARHHLTLGNRRGADSLCERALRRLAPYPGRYLGFDLDGWRERLQGWRRAWRDGDALEHAAAPLAPWHFPGLD